MNWSDFMSIGALLVSIIIAINGLKKGKADTFSSYQDSLNLKMQIEMTFLHRCKKTH